VEAKKSHHFVTLYGQTMNELECRANTKCLLVSNMSLLTPEEVKKDEPVNAVSSNVEALSQQMTETRRVKHRTRRDDSVFRQTAELPRDPGHDVARVSDDDDDSVRTVLDNFRHDALEDADVLLHQVQTCLPFLLTSSSGNDDHSRILQCSQSPCIYYY